MIMITITDYILNIYEDFKEYIEDQDNDLCELRELTYQAGQIPDYTSLPIQQLYLLRYVFAYAFEYKIMFKDLFITENFPDKIEITSIGCGNMIDYWSLVNVLEEEGNGECRVNYIGIDQIDWNYKIEERVGDNCMFLETDATAFFSENQKLSSNIYMFPKSISEFTNEDFENICTSLSTKDFFHNKIYVLISIRADEGSMDRDMNRSKQIIKAFCKNGFTTECNPRSYKYFENGRQGIKSFDYEFDYPDEAIQLISYLNKNCSYYKNCHNSDTVFCKMLNRNPILTVNNIRYQILIFDRKD